MLTRQFLPIQSNKNPAAIAIKDTARELTYEELNTQVNQLANYLCKQGVQPESVVGIYADRSVDLVIAILAVLQAGGAYVPLDPAYPPARLATIIADTELQLVLTQSHLVPDLQHPGLDLPEINLILLDTEWVKVANESTELVAVATTPANLAYIMYTSGSTGKPQGVQITIGQVECYLQAINEVLNIQADDIYLHSASFSFSSSVRQLLLPLAQGAKVVITAKENTTNLFSLIELIQTEQITVFDTVASVWNYILIGLATMEEDQKSRLMDSRIRLLTFSGGLLTAQLLERVRSQFQQSPRIVNIYGQTETIGVCAYQIPAESIGSTGYAPVGIAYSHNQLYVLDDLLQPVATAQTGELYVSGTSLARGYLNNPQLNARKFIPNPFSQEQQSAWLYKTGDLARYLPDGNLEIVGRQDFQVKIRGMRVEVEEIETVLAQHPHVQQAAVVGKDNSAGEQLSLRILSPIVLRSI
jgi:amino acid adenylation domain-containing protein